MRGDQHFQENPTDHTPMGWASLHGKDGPGGGLVELTMPGLLLSINAALSIFTAISALQ